MTLLSYQVFQTVVGQGSFQKAAEILNLTPSAVSHAICIDGAGTWIFPVYEK